MKLQILKVLSVILNQSVYINKKQYVYIYVYTHLYIYMYIPKKNF